MIFKNCCILKINYFIARPLNITLSTAHRPFHLYFCYFLKTDWNALVIDKMKYYLSGGNQDGVQCVNKEYLIWVESNTYKPKFPYPDNDFISERDSDRRQTPRQYKASYLVK